MELSKFQKVIWGINGVLILVVFVFTAFFVLKEFLRSFRTYNEPELIVGEELEAAKEEGLILQGLEFSAPSPIFGSNNYIVPIEIRTYKNPKEGKMNESGKMGLTADYDFDPGINYRNMVNVVFLDNDMKVHSKLLNKKAFIKNLRYPSKDNSKQFNEEEFNFDFIVYEIAFEDSNKDGGLNDNDDSDLYISDLKGENLTKITTSVDVIDYKILNPESILIRYISRTSEVREHKRDHLSLYSVKTNELKELSSFDSALDEIEKNLFK